MTKIAQNRTHSRKVANKSDSGSVAAAKTGHLGNWTLAEDTTRFTEGLRSRDRIVEGDTEVARRSLVGAGIMQRNGKLAKPYR
jgi:hypothetical protein